MLVDLLHHSLPALIQPNVNEAYRAGHNRDRHGGQAKVQSQVRADNKEREAGFEFGELQIGLTLMNNETQRLDKTLFISKKDVEMLTELDAQYHVKIYTQYSPALPAEPWTVSVKSKFKE